jgi:pyridoxamine 5'-phosphate oxidase-like protein
VGKQFDRIEDAHKKFIEQQHMFFCATAAPDGLVNVSPKGMDSLRVMGPNRICWMNITGSANETAGHLLDHKRMTLMWCSFTTRPIILRTYGSARAVHPDDADWDRLAALFPTHRSARQVFDLSIDLVQTSCGYAVPFMEYAGERDTMQKWVDARSDDDIRSYWVERNATTLDGKPTGVTGT